jgi:hypothetical protein
VLHNHTLLGCGNILTSITPLDKGSNAVRKRPKEHPSHYSPKQHRKHIIKNAAVKDSCEWLDDKIRVSFKQMLVDMNRKRAALQAERQQMPEHKQNRRHKI